MNVGKKSNLYWVLLNRAKLSYPFPPNPFCSNTISTSLVRDVLLEAGYDNFTLTVTKTGIEINPKVEG
jgi:hypothetical protein